MRGGPDVSVWRVTPDKLECARDFGVRFGKALQEFEIFEELQCRMVVTACSEAVCIRLERNLDDETEIDYLDESVFYDRINEVSDRAFEATRLAYHLLATLLLRTWVG